MLTHANLLHNSAMIFQALGHGPESRGVSWLPPYHDMGLIGGILQPLFGGFPAVLLSPVAFLQSPYRWLNAISHYRGTSSGGPNFAYDLCVRAITPEQRDTLDLSSWEVAFNGSEPIHAETLERFAITFKSCGFRPKALYPCYGLAEATLFVSGRRKLTGPELLSVRAADLEENRVVETGSGSDGNRILVSSGQSPPGHTVRIVDPHSSHACGPATVGEIWVASPSIALGYWGKADETERTFHANVAESSGEV